MSGGLTIALSKGRIYEESLPLLAQAGIRPLEDPASSRKLIIETDNPMIRVVVIRAADVPTYVQYGAADVGVAGKDVLMEHGGAGLYEPLDLGIARCRMMVAGPEQTDIEAIDNRRLRIATKYVQTAHAYFARRGRQVEVIKLYGSMELAPLVNLSDFIVDLVDTGGTLRANGLVEKELIAHISSRLVVNKAAMKLKQTAVSGLVTRMREAVASRDEAGARSAQA